MVRTRATSPAAELCPICSAEDGQCSHEILRYSHYAEEFEQSKCAPLIHRLIAATRLALEHALARGGTSDDRWLTTLLEQCDADAETYDEQSARELVDDIYGAIADSCLRWLRELPSVRVTEQSRQSRNDTEVFWSDQPEPVEDAIERRIDELALVASFERSDDDDAEAECGEDDEVGASVARFVGYFRGQATLLDQVTPIRYRKTLYVTALETLACAAYPSEEKSKTRFLRLVRDVLDWPEADRVSLPQLALALREEGLSGSDLDREASSLLAQWPAGHVLRLSSSPTVDHLRQFVKSPREDRVLRTAQYAELLYAYRCTLVHEFREPGYGIEMSNDKDWPYYHSQINGPWQLVFPVGFFARSYQSALARLEQHLQAIGRDPYEAFRLGSRWSSK